MLTKDHLKFTKRGDKITPKYLKVDDPSLLELAQELDAIFKNAIGIRVKDLEENLKAHEKARHPIFEGLCKLLEDKVELSEPDPKIEAQRWQAFALSKELRSRRFETVEEFQEAFEKESGASFSATSWDLYSDRPDDKKIIDFKPYGATALLHRYNAAQIQGLLIKATELEFKISDADIAKKRRLLQRLRFWRLLAEVEDDGGSEGFILKISGPLSLFDEVQRYGLRLCNFFPLVLQCHTWELKAGIKLDGKTYMLTCDSKKPITSHYQHLGGHVPEEFQKLIEIFNELPLKQRQGWKASLAEDCLNLGRENYAMPDFLFQHESGEKRYLEVFHRWHQKEWLKRLGQQLKEPEPRLILGASQDVETSVQESIILEKTGEKSVGIFRFKQFPTPKAIIAQLPQVIL